MTLLDRLSRRMFFRDAAGNILLATGGLIRLRYSVVPHGHIRRIARTQSKFYGGSLLLLVAGGPIGGLLTLALVLIPPCFMQVAWYRILDRTLPRATSDPVGKAILPAAKWRPLRVVSEFLLAVGMLALSWIMITTTEASAVIVPLAFACAWYGCLIDALLEERRASGFGAVAHTA